MVEFSVGPEARFLSGGGEMGALMCSHDWSQTPLGPVSGWPQSLKTALRILLDSGYAMYIAWGGEFIQFYNDAFRPILGAKKHPSALGQTARECFSEIQDFIGPLFLRVMREGQNTTLIDQLLPLDRNGYLEECYFTFSCSAIRDETGGVGGVLVTVIETTGRLLEERRQQTLCRLASRSLEASSAVEVLERAAATLAGNPHDLPFAQLFLKNAGGDPELTGSAGPPLETFWPFDAVNTTGTSLDIDLSDRRLLGAAWPEPVTKAHILPIFDADQSAIAGFLVSGISPRLALDHRYLSFLGSLAGQISTALMKVRAFEEKTRRAEALAELNRAKTVFLSNVSHEFRTPLTLMLSPIEELIGMKESLPREAAELLSLSWRNGVRLRKLVKSVLDFSWMEAGRVEPSFEPTDLAAATKEIASVFRSAMEKAGLAFVVDCPPLSEPVYVDREMWEQIVLNLVSNAFKYTFEGAVTIALRERDGQAVLSVADSGTGIPERELPRLFERFYRVKGARGRTQEGAGIGLGLVAEWIRLHQGRIDVRSKPGEGSTFEVSLPVRQALSPGHPQTVPESRTTAKAAWTEEGGAMTEWRAPEPGVKGAGRVLVADDNADMRDYLTRLLSVRYEVTAVSNGEQALRRVREDPPDLVLSDVMMPGLDGFELLLTLRHEPATQALPAILLSAGAGEEARVEGMDAGAADYMVKPFTARELLARVGSQIEMARLRKEASQRDQAWRAEVQADRDRLLGILESIADGFFTLDKDWRFSYVNTAGARQLQSTRERLLGNSLWELFPELIGTVAEEQYRRAIREWTAVSFEIFYEPWSHLFSVSAYPAWQGGLTVCFRDITEARQADTRIQKQWQTFDAALSHTPDHIYTLSPEGRFTYANRAVLEFRNQSLDDLLGKTFLEIGIPPDRAARVDEQIRRVIHTKEPVRGHTRAAGVAGEMRDFDYTFVPVIGPDGTVDGVAGSSRDVTDRERIEKALAASERKLQQVLAQAPAAIVVLSGPEFIVELANPPYQALLRGRELLGRRFAEVVPELPGNVWEAFHRVYETGEPYTANEWLIRYDADFDEIIEDHWFNVVYNPRRDASGLVTGIIAVLTEVTAQVLARRELERVNRELEEFAYVASHDLQEPLRMVNTFTQLLLSKHVSRENAEARQYAGFITQGVERMEKLIRDLLSYSQIVHRTDLKPDPANVQADLNAAWNEALAVMSARIAETGALVHATLLPAVSGDTRQIAQVFQNLLSNALKYRKPDTAPEISVSARLGDGKWVVAVRDNGIGFHQKYAQGIFGLFKRLHRDEYPGTGLGLAICQRIVERCGGRIWAESQPGAGSTFFIEFPAVAEKTSAEKTSAETPAPALNSERASA